MEVLTRPCVDCGQIVGIVCDFCFAESSMPEEVWADWLGRGLVVATGGLVVAKDSFVVAKLGLVVDW